MNRYKISDIVKNIGILNSNSFNIGDIIQDVYTYGFEHYPARWVVVHKQTLSDGNVRIFLQWNNLSRIPIKYTFKKYTGRFPNPYGFGNEYASSYIRRYLNTVFLNNCSEDIRKLMDKTPIRLESRKMKRSYVRFKDYIFIPSCDQLGLNYVLHPNYGGSGDEVWDYYENKLSLYYCKDNFSNESFKKSPISLSKSEPYYIRPTLREIHSIACRSYVSVSLVGCYINEHGNIAFELNSTKSIKYLNPCCTFIVKE